MDSFDMVNAIISGEELVPSIPRKNGKSSIMKGNGTLMSFESGGITFTMLGGVPDIKKVIFNKPATIILWDDDTKTMVKCGDGEVWDPEKGMAMAVAKKALGNKGNYNEVFKKWLNGQHCMTKTDIILEYQAEKAKRAEERRNGAKG